MPSVARLGMIAATAATALLLAVAVRAERVVGDAGRPWLTFAVHVDDVVDPDGLARTWRDRMPDHHVVISLAPSPRPGLRAIQVEVFGAGAADTAAVLAALTASANFELRPVVSGSETTKQWYAAVKNDPPPDLAAIDMDLESWTDLNDELRFDYYVRGPDLATVGAAVARLERDHPVPAGVTVMYERVEPPARGHEPRSPYYRSYLVSDEVIITNDHLASAAVTYDPNTLLPEVMVELTDDGRQRFGDATAAMIGDKLAILVDRAVRSAPVVMGAIRGGRTAITMGGTNPRAIEADATALAATLSSSARLPDGLDARLVGTHGGSAGLVWLVRGLVGLAAGALAAWLAAQADRRRWFVPAPAVKAAPIGARAATRCSAVAVPAAITAGVPLALWFAARELFLPFVNEIELSNVMSGGGDPAMFGVFALGIMPVVSAFVLVELVAVALEQLLPGRRGRRLGTPADRRGLDLAAWLTALALAAMQAYFMATYFDELSLRGAQVLTSGAAVPLLVLTLTAGVMVQVIAAEVVSRHGLCNGYLALLGAAAVATLVAVLDRPPPPPGDGVPDRVVLVGIFATAALSAVAATRVRSVTASGLGPRLPYTGAVPASLVRGGLGLVALAASWSTWVADRLQQLGQWAPILELAATVPMAGLILWTARRPWSSHGVAATFAFLVPLVLLPFLVDAPFRIGVPLADGVLFGLLISELTVGVRARAQLADATTVLVVHDVFTADDAADRLAAAGIPHAILGARARAALRMFGAFVPVELRVPSARADDARAALIR